MVHNTACSFLGRCGFDALLGMLGAVPRGDLERFAGMFAQVAGGRWSCSGPSLPDLCDVLRDRGLGGPPGDDVAAFRAVLAPWRDRLVIGRCRVDTDGAYAVSVYLHPRNGPRVRPGDVYFAGAQLSGSLASGSVRVEPHVMRLVCGNGASVGVESTGLEYVRREAGAEPEGDLEKVVLVSMSGYLVPSVEAGLRRAATTPVSPLGILRAGGRIRVTDEAASKVLEAQRAEEPTQYGLYNAMTRVARDMDSLAAALDLERAAGRLVGLAAGAPGRETVERRPVPV